jgi:hypothetical protein
MPDGYRPAMPQVRDMDELFGTHREHLVGDQQLAQVVRGSVVGMGVEGLVGGGQVTGGDLGEQPRAGALAQPVQRRPGGCAWR